MQVHNSYQERMQFLHSKQEWLEMRLKAMDQPWPFDHEFKYSEDYDLWRASYEGKIRLMIRDYQALTTDLKLDDQYVITIESDCIVVRKPLDFIKESRYEMLLADVPMEDPLEAEDFAHFNYSRKELIVPGFLSTKLKSHVHRFYKKDQLFLLHDLYTAEFGPMGYTLQTLFDGVFFVILMTHSTETPDACVQHFTNGGYRPYDLEQARAEATAKAVPKQMPDVKALLAREKALLAELADIRKQMAGC